MVKSLTAILVSIALLLGAAIFERKFVGAQFTGFGEELETLYEKTENETATAADAKSVQTAWETRKKKLYVWVPHNDLTRIDDYIAESVRLIGREEYVLALAKLEIVRHLTECLPDTYSPEIENIL